MKGQDNKSFKPNNVEISMPRSSIIVNNYKHIF